MKKVLVFDIGGSSGRAKLCSYENKSFVSTSLLKFSSVGGDLYNKNARSTDSLLREVGRALYKAEIYGFDAISVNVWGENFGLLNKGGDVIPCPDYGKISLSEKERGQISKKIDRKDLYMHSGIIERKNTTLHKLLSIQEKNPALLSKAAYFMTTVDIINFYLTGQFTNEYTAAAATGLINLKEKNWNFDLINILGLPKKIFGKIVMPGEKIGNLKSEFTKKEIPVFASPSYSAAAAILSVPSAEKKFAYIDCGITSVFGTELDQPLITEKTYEEEFSNLGGYGNSVAFSKPATGTYFLQECRRYFNSNGEVFTFNDMEAFARSAPANIAKVNLRDQAFSKSGNMPQKVQNYCEATGQTKPKTLAQTLRIIYESIAQDFAINLEELEKITGDTYPAVYIFGGGSKDSFLCQLIANATGRTVIAGPTDAVAIGNAMSSLIALGEIKNVSEARGVVRRGEDIKEFVAEFNDGEGRR